MKLEPVLHQVPLGLVRVQRIIILVIAPSIPMDADITRYKSPISLWLVLVSHLVLVEVFFVFGP